MLKNITVTSIDDMGIADRHNMGQEQPRKKIKMLHEQLFEQYGIDPTKVYEHTGLLKTIPQEWVPDILLLNINSCKTPRVHQTVNLKEKVFTIGFATTELCDQFYGNPEKDPPVQSEFNMNISKSINKFLESKNEEPKKYNRIIVTESSSDGLQVTIRY